MNAPQIYNKFKQIFLIIKTENEKLKETSWGTRQSEEREKDDGPFEKR